MDITKYYVAYITSIDIIFNSQNKINIKLKYEKIIKYLDKVILLFFYKYYRIRISKKMRVTLFDLLTVDIIYWKILKHFTVALFVCFTESTILQLYLYLLYLSVFHFKRIFS